MSCAHTSSQLANFNMKISGQSVRSPSEFANKFALANMKRVDKVGCARH